MKADKLLILLFVVLMQLSAKAQHEADIWYFGDFAGMDFRSGNPVALTNSAMSQAEGCASISDKEGNLLFYTNGITVWNKNHSVMQNGTGLMGHPSSTQSGVIVPKPGSNSLYYIFTVPAEIGTDGLRYSVVDMSLDNGLGAITNEKNVFLISPTEEKVTAVKHKNGVDVWVATHLWNSSDFYVYLITKDGIQEPVLSSTGTFHEGNFLDTHGYMKFSPDGKKLAIIVRMIDSFELFDFNNETGTISNPVTFPPYPGFLYGVEFSPDNSVLYISEYLAGSYIFQFDLSSSDPETIINSKKTIGTVSNIHLGALQLAPDSKIYVSKHDNLIGDNYLGVINSPNEVGMDCNFVEDGFYLAGKKCLFGLPDFIQSYFAADFTYEPDCFGDSTWFNLEYSGSIDSVRWDFGDPASGGDNFSNQENPFHIFSSPGTFLVQVIIYTGGSEYPIEKEVVIFPSPVVDLGNDTSLCSQNGLLLKAGSGFDTYLWQDGSTDSVYLADTSGIYWVQVTNACGMASDTIRVTFGASFDIDLGPDTSFCYGQSVLLSPGGRFYSYYWQDGSTDSVLLAGNTGFYWVQVTDSAGCTATDSIYIDAYMEFSFSLGPDTMAICEGDYVILKGPAGYSSYKWQDGSDYPDFIADTAGIYWLEVSEENGCAARDSVLLMVNIIPDDFLGNDTVMCEGGTFTIHAPPDYEKYLWQDGSTDSVFTAYQTGDYWVYVEDSIGCSGTDTISLSLFEPPQLSQSGDTLMCPGDTLILSPGEGMLYYKWNTGSTDSAIWVTEEGDYWVEIGTQCGIFTDSIWVELYSNPDFSLGADTNICGDEKIILSAGGGYLSYLWSDGSQDSILTVYEPGTYWVDINDGRCMLSDTVKVDECNLLWIPNVFTPNNDGYNDYFYAVGENVTKFKMVIFNRWGVIMATLNSIEEKWDGRYKGTLCADGVYYYEAVYEEIGRDLYPVQRKVHGSVTLISEK